MFEWVLGYLLAAVKKLAGFLLDLWEAVKEWFVGAALAIWEAVLDVCASLAESIPVPAAWADLDPWGSLPGQALWLLGELKVPETLAVIGAAWGIRFALNLIPGVFTRV